MECFREQTEFWKEVLNLVESNINQTDTIKFLAMAINDRTDRDNTSEIRTIWEESVAQWKALISRHPKSKELTRCLKEAESELSTCL
jgi:hypothetical protein